MAGVRADRRALALGTDGDRLGRTNLTRRLLDGQPTTLGSYSADGVAQMHQS